MFYSVPFLGLILFKLYLIVVLSVAFADSKYIELVCTLMTPYK